MASTDGLIALRPLRVLIANERQDRLVSVRGIVESLGHTVIAPQTEVEDVAEVTRGSRPDVALVGLGESSEHALDLIERIVHESVCPVVALLHRPDHAFLVEAARRGVFAYATDDHPSVGWQSAIEIALHRFAQLADLEAAFAKRATIEQAKGMLMERGQIDELEAVDLIRKRARAGKQSMVVAAQAVIDGARAGERRQRRGTTPDG